MLFRSTIKKAEHQRIDDFELWCWRRLSRVPWIARTSNQVILKEINPEYSLEGLMLKLKVQYFGHLMRRANSLGKIRMLGKTEGRRRRGRQTRLSNWTKTTTTKHPYIYLYFGRNICVRKITRILKYAYTNL